MYFFLSNKTGMKAGFSSYLLDDIFLQSSKEFI